MQSQSAVTLLSFASFSLDHSRVNAFQVPAQQYPNLLTSIQQTKDQTLKWWRANKDFYCILVFFFHFFLCDIDRPDRQLSFRRCMLCTPFKAPYSQISQVWTLKNGGAQYKQPLWKSWPISQWGVNLVTYTQQPSTTQKLSIRTIKPQQAIWKQKLSMMQQLRSYSSPLSI